MKVLTAILLVLSSAMASAASPVAYVYVQENGGFTISAFDAASDGKLTQMKGSPFSKVEGTLIGTNGTHLIAGRYNGEEELYSYAVSSTGDVGALVSEINVTKYAAGGCMLPQAYPISAELDHTGSYVYEIWSGWATSPNNTCMAIQTFEISKSGTLTFKGVWTMDGQTFNNDGAISIYDTLTLTGNSEFGILNFTNVQTFLARESSGVLNAAPNVSVTNPTPGPGYAPYVWLGISPDPTNHLAVLVDSVGTAGQQLASYTFNSKGDFVSTNTWENMPTLSDVGEGFGYVSGLMLNPAATVLAVAVDTGTQFFHFNGAKPITKFTGIIGTSGYIAAMAWDKSNHLYALNGESGKLHVYDATTTSVKEAPGSPYSNIPWCGFTGPDGYECPLTLVVRSN